MGLFGFMKKNSNGNSSLNPNTETNNTINNSPTMPAEQDMSLSPLPFNEQKSEPTPFPENTGTFTPNEPVNNNPSTKSAFDIPDFSDEEIVEAQKPLEEPPVQNQVVQESVPIEPVEEPVVNQTPIQKPIQTDKPELANKVMVEQPVKEEPKQQAEEETLQSTQINAEKVMPVEQPTQPQTENVGLDLENAETNNKSIPNEWMDESSTEKEELEPSPPINTAPPILKEVEPVEERVVVRHEGSTQIFVEKEAYKSALLEVAKIVKDSGAAADHITRILDNEAIVSAKLEEWHTVLDEIQEKLMFVDTKLFDKGDNNG